MNTVVKVEGTCGICGDIYTGTMAQMYCYNSLECSEDNGDSFIFTK